MSMPGFTAETSLYKADGYYQVIGNHLAANGAIHPSGPDPNCVADCADNCSTKPTNQQRQNCYNRCYKNCPYLVSETI